MALAWKILSLEKPADEQDCLVSMKHGIHQGTWSQDDQCFHTYLFNDVEFNGYLWVPIEDVQP